MMLFALDEKENTHPGEEDASSVLNGESAGNLPEPDAGDGDSVPAGLVAVPENTDVSETTGDGAVEPVGGEEGVAAAASAPAVKKKGFKALLRKWWFWLIVGLVIAGIGAGITVAVVSSGSGSSSYSSGIDVMSPFVRLVKTTTNTNYGITYGTAFDSFFSSPRWRYFLSDSGMNVVEFTGRFSYADSPATALIQFVVDLDEGSITASYLEINGIAQNRLMLATLIGKVFSSY